MRKSGTVAALLYNSAHFAPIVEYASKARPLQGGKVIAQNFSAFRGEQIAKGFVRDFRNAVAENGFGTGAERMNLAIAVKRNDAVRRCIKYGAQIIIGHGLRVLHTNLREIGVIRGGLPGVLRRWQRVRAKAQLPHCFV